MTNLYQPLNGYKELDSSGNTDAFFQVNVGAYMAVVISAFGGVRSKTAQNKTSQIHPLLILILVVPLFVVQMTTIFALRLDLDISKGVGVKHPDLLESDKRSASVLGLKCLMVLVVQLTSFGVMMGNMKTLVFVCNPVTWFEVAHPHAEEWVAESEYPQPGNLAVRRIKLNGSLTRNIKHIKWVFHPILLGIPCLISLGCRFTVSYLVCVDSMSIIFASSTMTGAIFNALVLAFINDLNEIYWNFLSVILNMDKMDEIQFTIRSEAKQAIDDIIANKKDPKEACAFCEHVNPSLIGNLIWRFPWLSRDHGFRRVEYAITFGFLCLFFLQQLFLVIFALATNVLPLARDICTMWRWSHGDAVFLKKLGPFIIRLLDAVMLVHMDLDDEVSKLPVGSCRPAALAPDDDETGMWGIYYRMTITARKEVMSGKPYTYVRALLNDDGKGYKLEPITSDNHWTFQAFWLGFALIMLLVIVAQYRAFRLLSRKVRQQVYNKTKIGCCLPPEDEEVVLVVKKDADQEIADLKAIIEEMQKDIKGLKEKAA